MVLWFVFELAVLGFVFRLVFRLFVGVFMLLNDAQRRRPMPSVRTFAGQLQGDSLTRQRRTEFVRDISQKSSLGPDQRLDAAGHHIEISAQFPDFVAPP